MQRHRETVIPQQPQYIPFIKVTPSYICGYYGYQGPKRKAWQKNVFRGLGVHDDSTNSTQQLAPYSGDITKSAAKKLKSACEILFALAKLKKVEIRSTRRKFQFRIALVTLTLCAPQDELTDRQLKKELLEPFLRIFRTKGMMNYIWKAELQQNGNLHFHILTDTFMDKTEVRNVWNRLQAKVGLIEKFHDKHGHRSPNGTDCKAVRSDKGMVNYMLKYMLKSKEKGESEAAEKVADGRSTGKIWDCSLNLKLKNDTAEPIENWQFELLERKVDNEVFDKKELETCTIYLPKAGKMWEVAPEFLAQRLIAFLAKVRAKGREKDVGHSAPVRPRR